MMKKNTSSAGIRKRVGPMMALGGYVQIPDLIKYESHGVVETTAIYYSQPGLLKSTSRGLSYCNEEEDLVDTQASRERLVQKSQGYRRRNRVLEVTMKSLGIS